MILKNPLQTLKVIAPGTLIILASLWIILRFLDNASPDQYFGVGRFFLSLIISAIGVLILAVSWHRYALLSHTETNIRPTAKSLVSYLGRIILIALVAIAIGLAMMLPAYVLVGFSGGTLNPTSSAAFIILFLLGSLISSWAILRISLMLPASALEHPMSIGESWEHTKKITPVTYLVYFAILIALGVIRSTLDGSVGVIGSAIFLLAQTILYFSFLSVLYGHLVEGHPLR